VRSQDAASVAVAAAERGHGEAVAAQVVGQAAVAEEDVAAAAALRAVLAPVVVERVALAA
jgi:hypothetical protein